MTESERIAELVGRLYQITAELEAITGRPFTPDGHLVGSLGEAYARMMFDVELMPPSNEGFDARTTDGRTVEIKATQRTSVAISASSIPPDLLLVFRIDPSGEPDVEYNGPAGPAWDVAGKPQKNGQRSLSIAKLRRLMESMPPESGLDPRGT